MKRWAKISLCIFNIMIILVIGQLVSFVVLKHFNLRFRVWIENLNFLVMVLLGLALAIILFLTFIFKIIQSPNQGSKKFLSVIGIISVLFGTGVVGIFGAGLLFMKLFSYTPEHVVIKYDQKMVASVYSFLNVHVEYREYKNFLVSGDKVIGTESYGKGGYDPFERDPIPNPESYEFFDPEGNLIASNK